MTFVVSLESCEIQLVWELPVLGCAETALSPHAMNMAACGYDNSLRIHTNVHTNHTNLLRQITMDCLSARPRLTLLCA